MRSPVCKYWGRGYTLCELPQAKPKIALVLPSLNLKASPFSLLPPLPLPAAAVTLQWSQAAQLGWSPQPKHSPSQAAEQPHASFWGGEGRGEKDRADKYTLPSPQLPPGEGQLYTSRLCSHKAKLFHSTALSRTPGVLLPDYRAATREATWHSLVGRS